MLESFICYSLEIIIYYFIAATLTDFPIVRNIKRMSVLPVFVLIMTSIEQHIFFHETFIFINIIFELLCLYFLLKCVFLDAVILLSLSYLLTVSCQILIMPFLSFKNVPPYSPIVSIVGNSIILLLAILGYLFLSSHYVYAFIQKNRIFKLLLGNFFILFFGIVCYSKQNPADFYSSLFLLFICILFLFMLNWDVIKNQKRLLEKEKELEIYQTYIPVISELIDQVRIRQHQFDNHIQAMQMLPATHKNYTDLADAITNYSEHVSLSLKHSILLKLNYKLLAGFLFSKCHQAENMKKELRILIRNTNIQTVVPEYELIDILGILIDNALEAISEGECVILTLDSHSNKCNIKIQNKGPFLTNELRNHLFKKGYTTKKTNSQNHGLGLYQLKQLVASYEGMIILSNEDAIEYTLIVFEIII